MDNLRTSIAVFFRHINPEQVLQAINEPELCLNPFRTELKASFLDLGRAKSSHYSKDEWLNIIQKLDEDWLLDVYGEKSKGKSIFNLLLHFSKQALLIENNEPVVNDNHLLRWRTLSYETGEDLLTCAHLSYMDARASKQRSFFAWKPVISSDNHRLKKMLNQGMAENHFHLKGSAPIFSLSWISLMNQIKGRNADFDKIEKSNPQVSRSINSFGFHQMRLRDQILLAAYIRKGLFKCLTLTEKATDLNASIDPLFKLKIEDYQADIHQLGYFHGLSIKHNGKSVVPDYAIPKKLHPSNYRSNLLLCGERLLLYKCFRKIFEGNQDFKPHINQFYLYLLIKQRLREELIQVNDKVGFANFLDYQDRKEIFIRENSIYDTAFLNTAVTDSLINQNILHFETRIAPKASKDKQIKAIRQYDKKIESSYFKRATDKKQIKALTEESKIKTGLPKHFYTVHFIKQKLEVKNFSEHQLTGFTVPRNYRLRKKVEQEAKALVNLKESTSNIANRIYGIDAASSEMVARPEVFAQTFRFLKDYKHSGRLDHLKENLTDNPLGATFHVGEDFLDVVDGLRAIDETILFLKLRKGDRLGHALALGINPKQYYSFKNDNLLLPKQNMLDNTAWLIEKYQEFGLIGHQQEYERLKSKFRRLFLEVYVSNFYYSESDCNFDISIYMDAWRLRGDAPELYKNWKNDPNEIVPLSFWDRCKINYNYPLSTSYRKKNKDARFLYHSYHYNAKIKTAGAHIVQQKITLGYVNLVTAIQECLLNQIGRKEIAIECNPTSNYLISTFKRYAHHPIQRFFNLGLTGDSEKIKTSPQIMVSINTDDQGIFGTSLENEYALLAAALKKEMNADGSPKYNAAIIYDWLDRIRRMGIEMSFENRN